MGVLTSATWVNGMLQSGFTEAALTNSLATFLRDDGSFQQAVTSVTLTPPAAGITVTGSPITTSGTFTLALADDLAALEALSGTNTIYYRSGVATWTAVTIGANLGFSAGTLGSSLGTSATHATGDFALSTTTVNGHALSSNVTVTASDVGLGSVTNDAQTKAAIIPNTAPSAGQVLVGNAGGTAYAPQSLSSDVTMTSGGVATVTINGQTAADIALTDAVLEYNASAAANRKVTVDRVGGFINPGVCGGRLTLTTGVNVTVSDVTSAGTIYFTPGQTNGVGHNRISVHDGTRWRLYTFSEISLALTATSGKNYDVFIFDNSGTLTLETLVWTNDSTRATALAVQDGVLVKSGATTRRYLGTFRANGTNTTEDSSQNRLLANAYNQVYRPCWSNVATDESTTSATLTDLTTKDQVTFVCGLAQDLKFQYTCLTNNTTGGASEINGSQLNLDASLIGTESEQKMFDAGTNYVQPIILRAGNTGAGFHTLKCQHRLVQTTGPAHWTTVRTLEVFGLWT